MINIENLNKKFIVDQSAQGFTGALKYLVKPDRKEVMAVTDLSLKINPGERIAFIGPNGAGKSTTIKMLSGILRPTSGLIEIDGLTPFKERKQLSYKIGTVFGQKGQLWYHLPAKNTFDLLASIYDLNKHEYKSRLHYLIDSFDVGSIVNQPVRKLSLGQRMRCEIIASLIHRPKILFLDEPTIGLDVTAKSIIRDLIKKSSSEEGTTIFLTSHDTGDMEKVCDRVIIINHGQLLIDGPVKDLRTNYIRKKIITLKTDIPDLDIKLEGAIKIHTSPHVSKFEIDTSMVGVEKLINLALAQTELKDITVEDPPMEEIIQDIYSKAKQ
ncbi:MAG: ATP-binding cassette domain-containing protein [Bdellovibrio sp.]